jgi:hypothetical protein
MPRETLGGRLNRSGQPDRGALIAAAPLALTTRTNARVQPYVHQVRRVPSKSKSSLKRLPSPRFPFRRAWPDRSVMPTSASVISPAPPDLPALKPI